MDADLQAITNKILARVKTTTSTMTSPLIGANSTDSVKHICRTLGIDFYPSAIKYSCELQNTLTRRDKCLKCEKQGGDTVECYYPVASVDDTGVYHVSYSLCPKAKKYLRQQQANRLLADSGIGRRFKERTFGTFKPTPKTANAFMMCRNFVKDYKPKTQGLRLWGNYGCGKTHLAAAIVNNLLAKNVPCMFVVVPELLDYIRQGVKDETKAKTAVQLIDMAKNIDVLVLDDLGAEKPSEWVKEQLFILINSRYEKQLTTIVTTNYSSTRLIEQLGQRIISRLLEMTTPIALDYAEDYRLKIAKAM